MEIKKTKQITKEVVEDIICNQCERSCKNEEHLQAFLQGGYGSKLGDGNQYYFHLCEDCVLELFKKFKIEPKYENDYNKVIY